jgi:hypothetical protein
MTWEGQEKVNSVGEKREHYNFANTTNLTKVIICLREIGKPTHISLVREWTGITHSRLKNAITWLVSNKIVLKERKNKVVYSINPVWEKLRGM